MGLFSYNIPYNTITWVSSVYPITYTDEFKVNNEKLTMGKDDIVGEFKEFFMIRKEGVDDTLTIEEKLIFDILLEKMRNS